jgi:nitroreductase
MKGYEMDVTEAIRKRRAVRTYTDKPVDDATLDGLLRLALRAPTGGGQQAWSLLLVRDPEVRTAVGELIIDGGATYFALMRPQKDATDEEHAAWAKEYAETVMSTYRQVPAFVVGLLVPRGYPEGFPGGYEDDLISLAFAFENLMLAARAEGLGPEVDPAIVSPIGYPEAFPTGLAPALKRNFRGWKALVHDDQWGNTRE